MNNDNWDNKILRDLYYDKLETYTIRDIPYDMEVIAENLFVPWAIDFSKEGILYFTERSGIISKIEAGKLQQLYTFKPPFIRTGEGGLLGIALDPDFLLNHFIYVMHSYMEGNQIYNRIVRLVEQNNTARIDHIIYDRIPGAAIHNGGRIKVGPDKKLYITTGDAGNGMLAQDVNSLAGKILRINLDGSIPEDNPFPGLPVYSLGHRNPQGMAWNNNNIMYETEHGQTAQDEVNRIVAGANYGWPILQGNQTSADGKFEMPLLQSRDITWAPSGIAYIDQGPWQGKLLAGALRGEQLLGITLNQEGNEVMLTESFLYRELGRIREVVQAEDGTIYLTTSNMDGRGVPETGDDKIIRLIPRINSGI